MAKDQKSYFLSSEGELQPKQYVKKVWEFLEKEEQKRRRYMNDMILSILFINMFISLIVLFFTNTFGGLIFFMGSCMITLMFLSKNLLNNT